MSTSPSGSEGAGDDALITLPGTGTGELLLLGHYDTVPRAEGQPLWEPRGDVVHGLGTYDMKAGVAMALEQMELLAGSPGGYAAVHLLVLGDEEWRLAPPPSLMRDWPGVRGVLCFEGAVPGKDRSVVHGRYGGAVLTSRVVSPSRRAELPLRGPSSVAGLGELLAALEREARGSVPGVQIIPTQVQASSAVNVTPPQATVTSVLRFHDREQLDTLLGRLPGSAAGCEVVHDVQVRFPALPPTTEGVALLNAVGPVHVEHRIGSSDCCWVAGRLPVILDGLGPAGADEHSRDEHLLISSIAPQMQLAGELITSLLS